MTTSTRPKTRMVVREAVRLASTMPQMSAGASTEDRINSQNSSSAKAVACMGAPWSVRAGFAVAVSLRSFANCRAFAAVATAYLRHFHRIRFVPAFAPRLLRQQMFGMRAPTPDAVLVRPVRQCHFLVTLAQRMELQAAEFAQRQFAHAFGYFGVLGVQLPDPRPEDDHQHQLPRCAGRCSFQRIAAPRRAKPASTPSAAGQGAGNPSWSRPTNRPAPASEVVTYSSCRIRIDGTPMVTSRITPPRQAVMTPAATADTGDTPNSIALFAPYTE